MKKEGKMTREILFRGFRESVTGDATICVDGMAVLGKWMYGYCWRNDTTTRQSAHITADNGNIYVVIPSTVGQYTGLDDHNGKKIFEGDIVNDFSLCFTDCWTQYDDEFAVTFGEGMFKCGPESLISVASRCEVVGTIFEQAARARTNAPHGEWMINSDGYYPTCSICKKEPKGGMTNYCPHCGAQMDK